MSLWRTLRSSFPIVETGIHLDHARAAPLSCRVDEAVRAFSDAASRRHGYAHEGRVASAVERARGRVGELLGADASAVAFVEHARRGLELALRDLEWRRGDRILTTGSAALPFVPDGVEAQHVPLADRRFSLDRIADALRHPRARLLVTDAVEPATGARAPLDALAELCADRGVLLCVDASHLAGALPLSLHSGLDYLVTDAHRFLLALPGTGLLLRNPRSTPDAARAADRFETGPRNALGIVALGASVDLLLELGSTGVEKRVLELTDRLAQALEDRALPLAVPRSAARSPIVTFAPQGESAARCAERLAARGIVVSAVPEGVRVSPHAYNTAEEIDALVDAL